MNIIKAERINVCAAVNGGGMEIIMNGTVMGLSEREVIESRSKHGRNVVSKKKKESFFIKFLSNLGDPVIRVLLGALVLNLIFSFGDIDIPETLGIAASVFLAAFISTLSERGGEAAFEKLKNSEMSLVRVLRAGEIREIDPSDAVVGDAVLISAGERICADGRMISGEISVDQSAFTGESTEVKKSARGGASELSLSDESSLFCGASVLSGEGIFKVERVGDATLYGRISEELGEGSRESPLKTKLRSLAKTISIIGYIAAALVAAAYLASVFSSNGAAVRDMRFLVSELLHALTLAITVVVVAVPEGLPTMIAVVLSSNIKKMVAAGVLVRKPVGIEAAGSMNILFTDKTGTLTEGKSVVAEVISGSGQVYKSFAALERCGRLATLFATSARYNSSAYRASDGRVIGGNAADRALLSFVPSHKKGRTENIVARIPFDSTRKYSAVTLSGASPVSYIKGAPEIILPRVTGYVSESGEVLPFKPDALIKKLDEVTGSAGRVIAVAMREGSAALDSLILIALVHMRDKLRPEAKRAVAELSGAGVQVVMITGDAKNTAIAIAKECSIIREGRDICISSKELSALSDERVKEIMPRLAVVCRALPTDKSRLVRLSGEMSLVVGMTGDGINDAPALGRADVGFAMGSGAQAAKDAGDIIILDNDLSSICRAVLYGRTVLKNIKKFIVLQLTMNLFAVGISMIGPFIGVESPVTVVQMLWVNIIMDTLGALAFAGEGALPEYMREPPKKRDAKILDGKMARKILWMGGTTMALLVGFLTCPYIGSHFRTLEGDTALLTGFFAFFIFASVACCFNSRSERLNIFANLGKNRAFSLIMLLILTVQILFIYLGGAVLRTVPLTLSELWFCFKLALLVIPIDALRKAGRKLFVKAPSPHPTRKTF